MDAQVMDLIMRVETRTRQLLLQYQALQQECDTLRAQLEENKAQIQTLQIEKKEWQDKYDLLKMTRYIDLADDDTRQMRKRINKMIRDIDQCISMLKVD